MSDGYYFKPATWVDDEDGGSVGSFYGNKIALEAHGHDNDPRWTIVFGNSRYGYERGGRANERTLADVKKIAETDARHRIVSAYETAKDTVARFEKNHIKTEVPA